ncbi:hypothetical protein [Micromonospora sp. NPDC048830]|uniref:hypothetical protein n=1 Tax=Micromonospora sp. NPDC048830 TaxID=3364257 RepID=UPI0037220181
MINPYTHHRAVGMLPTFGLDRMRPAFFPPEKVPQALDALAVGQADKLLVAPQGVAAAQR